MSKLTKKIIISAVVVILIGFGLFTNKTDPEVKTIPIINNDTPSNTIVIEVKGQVKKPGLYYLESNDRINDAIIKAGGFTINAKTDNLNLAQKVYDGMVIYVEGDSGGYHASKISINTASIEQLMTLNGIGESKARSIIEYRSKHGRFNTFEDLINVSGISTNTLEQIKDFICL